MARPRHCAPRAATTAICTTPGSSRWPEPGGAGHPATIRPVRRLWRRVKRFDPARVSALLVAAPVVAVLAAYALAASTASSPAAGALTAVGALVAVAVSGLLYAWRLGAGGLS